MRNLCWFFVLLCVNVSGQNIPVTRWDIPSVQVSSEKDWDKFNVYEPLKLKLKSANAYQLKKMVFGWYPYWSGTQYTNFDFSLLSDVAYFSYEVDPNTGNPVDLHYWKTTPLVDLAKAAGTRVSLTATLFSGHKTFFENSTSRYTLIDSLVANVRLRGARGINLDFEAVPSSQRSNLVTFVKELSQRFRDSVSGAFISIAIPAVDWSDAFDVVGMEPYIDLFIIMGYDYYYPGSDIAGPVSPKNNGNLWAPYDVTRSVRNYLKAGLPSSKLSLGVPYYGYQWLVNAKQAGSETLSQGSAVIYNTAVSNVSSYRRLWDENASVPWYQYLNSTGRYQCWYDDETSLGLKYDMVNAYDIAGVGIWALGYDRTQTALWNLLREKFSDAGNMQTDGTFSDMGGPAGNYFSDDDYWQKFSVSNSSLVSCLFSNFSLADGDSLFAFDGSDPIGVFTGQRVPFIISGSKGLNFHFRSDPSSVSSGWMAYWHAGKMVLPGSLQLSADTLSDSRPAGAFIGKLSISDTAEYTFSLYGNESADNAFFRISGDSLFSAADFYYPDQSSYTLTIASKFKDVLAIDQKTIRLIPKRTSSAVAFTGSSEIKIYPNPSHGLVFIENPEAASGVVLLDETGRTICRFRLKSGLNRFELSDIPSGVYYLLNEGVWVKKIILMK
jgi:spore germination protein YaaH